MKYLTKGLKSEVVDQPDWREKALIAALLDNPICISILKELKSGPTCINDLAGVLCQPRHVIMYNIRQLHEMYLVEASTDPNLTGTKDRKEVFNISNYGRSEYDRGVSQ